MKALKHNIRPITLCVCARINSARKLSGKSILSKVIRFTGEFYGKHKGNTAFLWNASLRNKFFYQII